VLFLKALVEKARRGIGGIVLGSSFVKTVVMTRHALGIVLAAALLIGCSHDKEAKTAARDHRPDDEKFEKADDPPLTANTRFAAGQLAESQGEPDRAIAQYLEALKLDPSHRDALFHLGQLYTQRRQFPQAVTMWQRYLAATKNSASAYSNLGYCYELSRHLDWAEQMYKAGIARDPTSAACRHNYALMLARGGRLNDALAQLSTVLSPAEAHYNIASVLEQQGQIEPAKAYYRRALELNPQLHDARVRLAVLNQASGGNTTTAPVR
jgi:tetratricopeptide (TPR) repeat protein